MSFDHGRDALAVMSLLSNSYTLLENFAVEGEVIVDDRTEPGSNCAELGTGLPYTSAGVGTGVPYFSATGSWNGGPASAA